MTQLAFLQTFIEKFALISAKKLGGLNFVLPCEHRGEYYIDFNFNLLFVGFVLCLSFLAWVGGLDWSLCLTHGRHVSLGWGASIGRSV